MDQPTQIITETVSAPEVTTSQVSIPPKKASKIPLILVVFLVILAFGAITFVLGKSLGGPKIAPKPIPTAVPTISEPTPTPDLTAGWEIYTNKKYGFEVKYYPELTPNESSEGGETVGQFTYLQSILFGTGLGGGNYLKSTYGFGVKIKNKSSLENFREEAIGHITDKIDSEEEVVINNNAWKKINYKIFMATDYIPITTAVINKDIYNFEVTASALDIDQILSTFKFLD